MTPPSVVAVAEIEGQTHLDALLVRVLALPACDGWTGALLRAVISGLRVLSGFAN